MKQRNKHITILKCRTKYINIPRNIARIFVRHLEILEQISCANNSLFIYISFSWARVPRNMINYIRGSSTEKKFVKRWPRQMRGQSFETIHGSKPANSACHRDLNKNEIKQLICDLNYHTNVPNSYVIGLPSLHHQTQHLY